ncbi:MAG: pantoate--beta-alanine ligase [Bacteroidota bacterium]
MIITTTVPEMQSVIQQAKVRGQSIGFTPTMGALHDGHLSLVRRMKEECDLSICSIFVNPTQFNQTADLDSYPRTVEADTDLLRGVGCDVLFVPSVAEMYPHGSDYELDVNLDGLDTRMEGAHRPGHFAGVVQVVHRLIEITSCDRIYMGQKDFQQFTIIRQMLRDLKLTTRLVVCDIVRGEDGLALSSRNRRLLPEHRRDANVIHRVLSLAKEWIQDRDVKHIEETALSYLSIPGFRPEYFDLINGHNLLSITSKDDAELIVACTAVWAGDVRLIDNMVLKGTL